LFLAVAFVVSYAAGGWILAVPAVLAIWAGWLYVNPYTDCSWCKGTGKHRLSTKRTYGPCWNPRCQRGTVQRLGSRQVHKAVRAIRGRAWK